MKTVDLNEAENTWDQFFDATKIEILKCEVLQDYSAIDMGPSLQAWINGDKARPIGLMIKANKSNEWGKQYAARRIKKTRFHVIKKPLTRYLEWEIESYRHHEWGEETFLVPDEKLIGLDVPDGDFWIFDKKRVVKFNYQGEQGQCIGGTIYDESDDISQFLMTAKQLAKHAMPLD